MTTVELHDPSPNTPFKLVFIAGNRRSGTTLLHNLLCRSSHAHPQIAEAQPLTHLIAAFSWGLDNYERMTADYFENREAFVDLRNRTCSALINSAWLKLGKPKILILKNPELSFHMPALAGMWPSARFLVCTRHPFDQIASEIEVARRRGQGAGEANRHMAIAHLCDSFERYAGPTVEFANSNPAATMLVRYEDWIMGGESEIIRIATFCGLPLDRPGLAEPWPDDYGLLHRLTSKPSFSELYGQPVSREKVGTKNLAPDERDRIVLRLGDLIRKLGYS